MKLVWNLFSKVLIPSPLALWSVFKQIAFDNKGSLDYISKLTRRWNNIDFQNRFLLLYLIVLEKLKVHVG